MPQPRKEQIKDVVTHHSRFWYSPIPGTAYTDAPDGTTNPYLVSGVPGGIQESLPATVLGVNAAPIGGFVGLAGNTISIKIDGGTTVTVLFAVTDTNVSRIANTINAAFIALALPPPATVETDYLRITSATIPSLTASSSIIITNVGLGTALAILGITAGTYLGTYIGTLAAVRGVITASQDFLGGFAPLRTNDGKSVVTDVPSSIQIYTSPTIGTYRKLDIPGGVPVHGRILRDPTNTAYRISYYARMPLEATVITFNSNFALLDGTDSFDVRFDYDTLSVGPSTVTFPAGPGLTRDNVIDQINSAYATTVGIISGAAYVIGQVGQPFGFENNEAFYLTVDGGAPLTIQFTTATITAQDVCNIINAATGATATATVVTSTGSNLYVKIASNNPVGRTSSIQLDTFPGVQYNTLQKLGLIPGLYKGFVVAEAYGNNEIRFRGIGRGATSSVIISGPNPTTLTRMGISIGTVYGLDEGEQPVNFPSFNVVSPTDPYPINALIPEVLEFGETSAASESLTEQFNVKSGGANKTGTQFDTLYDGIRSFGAYNTGVSRGVKDAGKLVALNPSGLIDGNLLRAAQDYSTRFFKKFVRGDYRVGYEDVNALVTSVIETPGTNGNPKAKSPTFYIDVDPDNTYTGNIALRMRVARDTLSTATPVQLDKASGFVAPSPIFSYKWHLDANTLLYGDTVLSFADSNTVAAGIATTGSKSLPLTDPTARYPRILEQEANATYPSLMKKANSIWTVTVGDGTHSFGDFNGTNAIQQALAYFVANVVGVSGLRIQCKAGTFTVNIANGVINIPANKSVMIEGISGGTAGASFIDVTDATVPMINVGSFAILQLRDLKIGNGIIQVPLTGFYARDVYFIGSQLKFIDTDNYRLDDCTFYNAGSGTLIPILLVLSDGADHGPFIANNCTFNSPDDAPVMTVKADNPAISLTTVNKIAFNGCVMRLGTTVNSAGALQGNCGVIDINATGSSVFNAGQGLWLQELVWRDCEVMANYSLGAVGILIHLQPVSNGTVLTALTDEWVRISRVVIDGGKWLIRGIDTLYNPFTIVGVNDILLNNVVIGFENGTPLYGTATREMGYFSTGVFGSPVPTTVWGAFAFYASNLLTMTNVKFPNLVQRCGTIGDMFIRYNKVNINNVDAMYVPGGTGPATGPNQRIRWRPWSNAPLALAFPPQFTVKDFNTQFSIAAPGTDWTVVEGTPGGDGAVHIYEPSLLPAIFDTIRVTSLGVGGGASNAIGFKVPEAAQGKYYTNSPTGLGALTIRNSEFYSTYRGIQIWTTDPTQGPIQYVNLEHNLIDFCLYSGIAIWCQTGNTAVLKNATVSGNTVNDCGNTTAVPGISIGTTVWLNTGTTDAYTTVSVLNNLCVNNNTTPQDVQIRIVSIDITTHDVTLNTAPRGIAIGNNCEHWGAGTVVPGQIQVYGATGGGASRPPDDNLVGLETSYVVAPGFARVYDDLNVMLQNRARLHTS